MYEVVTHWNLSRPDLDVNYGDGAIKLRGYHPDTRLTGDFATKLKDDIIKPLSVSNIADKICPTRRDLYFQKGLNQLKTKKQLKTWGGKAGYLVENFLEISYSNVGENPGETYDEIRSSATDISQSFRSSKKKGIGKLRSLELNSSATRVGDTEWLLTLLEKTGRLEMGLGRLHLSLFAGNHIDTEDVKIKEKIAPDIRIGISKPATPDFIIPKFGIVGDIKTGIQFERYHQLTCAGYALAYEEEKREAGDIDWGIIYFVPTRNLSAYVKPITFPQLYIFRIDDSLRQWFIGVRDEAYKIISKTKTPPLPQDKEKCPYCRYIKHCRADGLKIA